MTPPNVLPQVLCVDDEEQILAGLALQLRRRADVLTATSGMEALEIIKNQPHLSVIVTDMRMPGMDGAQLLHKARQIAPDAVRLLLTGYTDIESAISAVNDGNIFRFLTKPCSPLDLVHAIDAAVEQHRLITSERVLLEETLHGAIRALTDVLALVSPAAFGRAGRIKQRVRELAQVMKLPDSWQLEVAAMLSQLGCITLPVQTAEHMYYGASLSDEEQRMVERLPVVTRNILGNIPRMEGVLAILDGHRHPYRATMVFDQLALATNVFKIAVDLEEIESQGANRAMAIDTIRSRENHYAPQVLSALLEISSDDKHVLVKELPVSGLTIGMIISHDVFMSSGTLLIARGYEVRQGFLERVRNFRPGMVREPIRVIIPQSQTPLKAHRRAA